MVGSVVRGPRVGRRCRSLAWSSWSQSQFFFKNLSKTLPKHSPLSSSRQKTRLYGSKERTFKACTIEFIREEIVFAI